MSQKMFKNVGYAVTGFFSLMMLFSGVMQWTANEQVITGFNHVMITNLATIRFIATMKILGVVGMWVPRGRAWAVHGFTFLFCGAMATHVGAGDTFAQVMGPGFGLLLLGASEWCARKAGGTRSMTNTFGQRKAA